MSPREAFGKVVIDPRGVEARIGVIKADIKRLLASITPANAKYIDE